MKNRQNGRNSRSSGRTEILLLGCNSWKDGKYEHSDSMIIVSIDRKTGKIMRLPVIFNHQRLRSTPSHDTFHFRMMMIANDNNPSGRFEPQIAYHEYECKYGYAGGKTWFAKKGYNYKWENWKRSNDDVRTLAVAYYWQYERSGAQNPGSRPDNAVRWYQYP